MLKNQKFGVEIEFTGITREKAAGIVARVLESTVSQPERNCYHTRKIKDSKRRTWKIMRDSSIEPERNDGTRSSYDEYRCEFVTPPLNYEDIEKLQEIVRALRAEKAKVNSSCGIHVHVDGANHTAASLKNLIEFMSARQPLINEALENEHRVRWCKVICSELKNEVKKEKHLDLNKIESIWYSEANDGYYGGNGRSEHYNPTRYHGLNLHSFFSKGTVEFRLFNSTLHAGKVKAYIQLCLAISAWAITENGRVTFRSVEGYTAQQKMKLMRNVLVNRLGLTGDEYRTCRQHLMEALRKNAEAMQAIA